MHIMKLEQSKLMQIHLMNIMFDLFPSFRFSCDNDKDEKLLHDASQDIDNSAQSS